MNRKIKIDLVQRIQFITEKCTDRRVLHLGCTSHPYTREAVADGKLLHSELRNVARELHGLDSDQNGLDLLSSMGHDNLHFADLENLDEVELNGSFDVIVAGEIIEHLNNPGVFLKGVQRFMDDRSILLLTTINAFCGMRFLLYGLFGQGGTMEPVHPDHVAYYSYSTLKLLLDRHGFETEEFRFYDIGMEHRRFNSRWINLVNDVAVRVAPQWADGLIALGRLRKVN